MNISAPFINRPIATVLLMVGLLLCGLASYRLLPVASLPNVNYPTISVTAQLPGADPQTMASSVATPLEEQFGQIPGIVQMTSSSTLGFTSVTVQFDLARNVDGAAADVLAAINAAGGQLPPNMTYPPTIRKVNPADTPILVLAVTSDTVPLTTVDAYAENILLQKISQISGVGLVGIGGQQKPAIRVQVNPQALASRGLSLETVRTVLGQANVDLPKGTLNSQWSTGEVAVEATSASCAHAVRASCQHGWRRARARALNGTAPVAEATRAKLVADGYSPILKK